MKKHVTKELVTVIAVMALGALAMSALQPILPLYLTSLGVSPEILGLMFSMGMVGMVLGEGSWGWLTDRVGLRLPLSAGTFVSGLVVILFIFINNIPVAFLILFLWGVFRSVIFPISRGYIGANTPLSKKATFMSIRNAIMAASRSLGALMSGYVVDTWGYPRIFSISAGIAFLSSAVAVIGLRKSKLKKEQPPTTLPPSTAKLPPSANFRILIPQYAVALLLASGWGVSMTFLPLLATQSMGVDATEVGILFTIGAVTMMGFNIPMGILADRKGKKNLMILGLLVSAIAMTGMAFASSYTGLIVFVIIQNLGNAMFGPAAVALVSDTVPLHRQNTTMGVYGIVEDAGVIAGSALAGFIWSVWGPRLTFLTGTAAIGLAAIVCFFLVRKKQNPGD